jgi:hypothetical protein
LLQSQHRIVTNSARVFFFDTAPCHVALTGQYEDKHFGQPVKLTKFACLDSKRILRKSFQILAVRPEEKKEMVAIPVSRSNIPSEGSTTTNDLLEYGFLRHFRIL